ncbi:MAG TPA: hypothetical protein VN493_05265 [Thermoanaerobaculia bacterium]|nr:hypothetical protein [Thermoanaerobaculia bacterium]
MKGIKSASTLALFLLSLAAPQPAAAQAASGTYRFAFEDDDLMKYVEFDASTDGTGQMTFVDQARISDEDPDEPRPEDSPPELQIRAELYDTTIEKNRALMNGTVVDSSHKSYIGKWVQLVVEDNGDNREVPDRLTWSFCKPREGGWIPTDAERKDDDGAYLSWWATDAERKDDVGIPSRNLISNEERGCQIHSLWQYSFIDVGKWEGDIRVQP